MHGHAGRTLGVRHQPLACDEAAEENAKQYKIRNGRERPSPVKKKIEESTTEKEVEPRKHNVTNAEVDGERCMPT